MKSSGSTREVRNIRFNASFIIRRHRSDCGGLRPLNRPLLWAAKGIRGERYRYRVGSGARNLSGLVVPGAGFSGIDGAAGAIGIAIGPGETGRSFDSGANGEGVANSGS